VEAFAFTRVFPAVLAGLTLAFDELASFTRDLSVLSAEGISGQGRVRAAFTALLRWCSFVISIELTFTLIFEGLARWANALAGVLLALTTQNVWDLPHPASVPFETAAVLLESLLGRHVSSRDAALREVVDLHPHLFGHRSLQRGGVVF